MRRLVSVSSMGGNWTEGTDWADLLDRVGAFAVGVFGAAPELASGIFAGLGGAEGHLATALGTLGNGISWIGRI